MLIVTQSNEAISQSGVGYELSPLFSCLGVFGVIDVGLPKNKASARIGVAERARRQASEAERARCGTGAFEIVQVLVSVADQRVSYKVQSPLQTIIRRQFFGLCSRSNRGLNRATMRRKAVLHCLIAQAECDCYLINPVILSYGFGLYSPALLYKGDS